MSISASGKFNPATDIPDLAGKVYFITGGMGNDICPRSIQNTDTSSGTAGLGAGTIEDLAKHNAGQIFFTGRNSKKANALIEKIHTQSPGVAIEFIECDQTSLASVKSAAERFLAASQRLDVLMLNAGVMALETGLSKDGYEQQFAINVLSHALFAKLLLPTMQATAKGGADVRIVSMSSYAHGLAPSKGIEFDTLKTVQNGLGGLIGPGGRWTRYGQTKLANLLYSDELARRYPEITSVSVHPGFVFTSLWDDQPYLVKFGGLMASIGKTVKVEEGHYNQLWAATCPKDKLVNGGYYVPFCIEGKRETASAKDAKLAEKLWEWTEKELSSY